MQNTPIKTAFQQKSGGASQVAGESARKLAGTPRRNDLLRCIMIASNFGTRSRSSRGVWLPPIKIFLFLPQQFRRGDGNLQSFRRGCGRNVQPDRAAPFFAAAASFAR